MAERKKAVREKRERQMQIRLKQSEYDTLERICGHYKKSEYVRQAVLEKMERDCPSC